MDRQREKAFKRRRSNNNLTDNLLGAAGQGVVAARGLLNLGVSTIKTVSDTALNPTVITHLLSSYLHPVQRRLGRYNSHFRALHRLLSFDDTNLSSVVCVGLFGTALLLPLLPWAYLMRGVGFALLGPHMYWYGKSARAQAARTLKKSKHKTEEEQT